MLRFTKPKLDFIYCLLLGQTHQIF